MRSALITLWGYLLGNYSIIIVISGCLLAGIILTKLSFGAAGSSYSKSQVYQKPAIRQSKAAESWHRQVEHKGCLYFMLGMMLVVAGFALLLLLDGIKS